MYKLITIDDEFDFRGFIKHFFEARKYIVYTASSGKDGLNIINDQQIDVALVDLKMPGMNGDEVLGEIKVISPSTKVIMITASEGFGKTRKKLLGLGAFACFDKPLKSLKELSNTVEKAINS